MTLIERGADAIRGGGVECHADTVDRLRDAFRKAVEDDLETCAAIGQEPQKICSERVMFRGSSEGYRKAAPATDLSGKSLNRWAEAVFDRAAGQADRS